MRKFRMQFSDSSTESSELNCLACVKELSKYIHVMEFGSELSFEKKYFSMQNSRNKIDFLELNQMTSVIFFIVCKISFMLKLIFFKLLIEKNEKKLPLIYQNEPEKDILNSEEDKVLQEFMICCLIDPLFPSFVKKVDYTFAKILKEN